ncbi:MAG TPA: lysophospholipid acyltransferase family protein [Vicinamibacterales bacterium]|nr:lysophospholipid acyltransferase family protein [Vicinamibacterales bacterium]
MRDAIEYWSVVAVRALARRLPEPVINAWGAAIGMVFYIADWQHRRVALANLEQCFPNKPARERRAIARATFKHFGRVLLKLLTFSTLTPEQMMAASEYEGDERVRLAYAKGKGILFFTGHFGFWELHALAHAVKLRPIGVLARVLDNPRLNDLLEQVRTKTGNTVIYRQGAVRRVLKRLHAGEGVALLIDQHMHSPDAIWVNFFRRPAATTSTLAALALRTGAEVIPVFAHPLPGGRYRFVYESPVEPPREDGPDAIREFTQRCTDVLEMHVRKHPELWLWMHRRWRDTSASETHGMFPKAKDFEA